MANEKKSYRWSVIIVLAMVLLTGIIVVSLLREKLVSNIQNQVNIVGVGKVVYTPDVAKVTVGVQVDRAQTAVLALQQLDGKMTAIIESIKKLGIEESQIITQNYYLAPQYDYVDGQSIPAGYSANQQLVVTINNVSQSTQTVQSLIKTVSESGANQIMGINFLASNLEDLKQQARVLAIKDAQEKAVVLAEAAGVKLDKIIGWWENYISSPEAYDYYGKGGAEQVQAGAITVGESEIKLEYNLSYRIK